LFLNIFNKNNKETQEHSLFWNNKNQLNKLHLSSAIKRIVKERRNDLVFDPIGFDEWIYLSKDKNKLKKLLYGKYYPKSQITLSMPKDNFTFRPVSYLLPSDSIIYQAIVDIIIKHKKDKFSNQVYSNIINDIDKSEVFDKPVKNWLRMIANIREQYNKGNNYYFSSDISGYYENIKINRLFSILEFYTGKNEKEFESLLKKLLVKWQFAEAQGLIQPHDASAILSKIYLTPVDSFLSHLKGNYSRYVDEFHIITHSKDNLLINNLNLCEKLRYLGNYLGNFKLLQIEIDKKFDEFVNDFENDKPTNMKVFRYCINKYALDRNPRAINFCLNLIYKNNSQIVVIVKYLSLFMNESDCSKTILKKITNYIENTGQEYYQWVKCWLLNLFVMTDCTDHVNKEVLKQIFMDKNMNNLTRATALVAYSKHSSDFALLFLKELYNDTDNVLFKRAILVATSKMPSTYSKELYSIEEHDELDIIVLKEYLLNNEYKIEMRV
jgi:hypothetical protein